MAECGRVEWTGQEETPNCGSLPETCPSCAPVGKSPLQNAACDLWPLMQAQPSSLSASLFNFIYSLKRSIPGMMILVSQSAYATGSTHIAPF